MLITYLTAGVSLAIVLVLATYLILIAVALAGAMRNVSRLADGLEGIAADTDPLGEKIGTIAGVLGSLEEGFGDVDENLGRAAGAFGSPRGE